MPNDPHFRDAEQLQKTGCNWVRCPMIFKHNTISGDGALRIKHTGHTFNTRRRGMGKPGRAAVGWVYGQSTGNREYELKGTSRFGRPKCQQTHWICGEMSRSAHHQASPHGGRHELFAHPV